MRPSVRRRLSNLSIYLFLFFVATVMLMPLIWMIPTAFKDTADIFANPLRLMPTKFRWQNFSDAWSYAPFNEYYWNTIIISFGLLAVQIVTITMAGYAFGRLIFPGRDFLFLAFVTQLMITPQSTILPNYITVAGLGLTDSKLGVMIPYFASAVGTFMLRQAFRTIPNEMEDAAWIDGCNLLQTIWYVALPLVKPSLVAFSIISVTHHWNEFLWPLIVTETVRSRPLTVGLTIFAQQAEGGAEWGLLMAATAIVVAPLFVGFLVFQRQFIESFISSGLKG